MEVEPYFFACFKDYDYGAVVQTLPRDIFRNNIVCCYGWLQQENIYLACNLGFRMLASINEQEHSEKLDRLKAALTTLTDLQRDTIYKKFYRNMSNVDIAAEEGVSEAAIRNRLKKIFANLAKKI